MFLYVIYVFIKYIIHKYLCIVFFLLSYTQYKKVLYKMRDSFFKMVMT